MRRAAVRIALVVIVLVGAGTIGTFFARRLWSPPAPTEQPPAKPPEGGTAPSDAGTAPGTQTASQQVPPGGTSTAVLPAKPAAEWVLTIVKPVGGTILGAGIRCGVAGAECVTRRPDGLAVTLRAQPDKGYRLSAFTGDCSPSGKTTMTAARTCSATFTKETDATSAPPSAPVLTITRPRDGTLFANGIVCGSGGTQCSAAQASGGAVTLRAQPDAGFKFARFTGDCDQAGTVMRRASRACGATFVKEAAGGPAPVSAILTITRPRDGTITGTDVVCGAQGTRCMVAQPLGTKVHLRAQPAPGFKLVAFTGDCDANGATVMTAARTCGATFTKDVGTAGTSTAERSTILAVAGQTARLEAPAGWQQAKWQVSRDAGKAWTDLADSGDYSGVATTVMRIRRPRLEMNGWQFRAVKSDGTTGKGITITVRRP